jgi:hypothetical protein
MKYLQNAFFHYGSGPIRDPCLFDVEATLRSGFHTSSVLMDETYLVAGQTLTVSQVRSVNPLDRTVGHWMVLVDWDLQRQHPYVVVDPFDPQGLLYLSRTEYLSQLKVWASNDLSVMVIARPGSKKPSPVSSDTLPGETPGPSQNSPKTSSEQYHYLFRVPSGGTVKFTRETRFSWQDFIRLRSWGLRFVDQKRGLVSVNHKTVARTVYMWGRELLHYAEVKNPGRRLEIFISFVRHLQTLLRCNGSAYTVKRMKIYLFVLYTYVLGNPLESTQPLGIRVRLQNGLPTWMSAGVRSEIRRGDLGIIRVWASMLNTYRALDASHPGPDYSTVSTPHPSLEGLPLMEEFKTFCREIFPAEVRRMAKGKSLTFQYSSGKNLLIRSAGANLSAPSILNVALDAKAWAQQPSNHILKWFEMHKDKELARMVMMIAKEQHFEGNEPSALETLIKLTGASWGSLSPTEQEVALEPLRKRFIAPASLAGAISYISRVPNSTTRSEETGSPVPMLGRLHSIEEPAGKVRIVAICDYWTQVALKPVHDHLFDILKVLRQNDATFDQQGTVDKYFQQGYHPHWSYDLKAATDTIPLALYKEVLTPFLLDAGGDLEQARVRTELWASILTDREFGIPKGKPIRYTCGQPMGALSSWASMALTHHALVQFSAWKIHKEAGYKWFRPYLILGDDVDIAQDTAVATAYVENCDAFQVQIGLAKTLHSEKNGFEFANQRFCDQGNISPLSLKEELVALSWSGRMELASRVLARFGTKSKDETMGLVRKVTTAPQWLALLPELTGVRSELIFRFVKFCLLNPFYLALRGKTELNIDSIVSWLTLLSNNSVEPDVESIPSKLELELNLVRSIYQMVRSDVDKVLATNSKCPSTLKKVSSKDIPPLEMDEFLKILTRSASWKAYEAMPERFRPKTPTSVPWGDGIPPFDVVLSAPKNAPVAYNYIIASVKAHNAAVVERAEALLVVLKTHQSMVPSTVAKATSLGWQWGGTAILQALKVWADWKSYPTLIDFDLGDPIRSLVPEDLRAEGPKVLKTGEKPKPSTQEIHERIYGPMREVCLEIGRTLGLEVPNLALFEGKRGKAWHRAIRAAVSEFLQRRIDQDASPMMRPSINPLQWLLQGSGPADFGGDSSPREPPIQR